MATFCSRTSENLIVLRIRKTFRTPINTPQNRKQLFQPRIVADYIFFFLVKLEATHLNYIMLIWISFFFLDLKRTIISLSSMLVCQSTRSNG